MVIDSHAHLEEEIPAGKLIELMDRDGVDRSVVFAGAMERIPSTPDRLLSFFRFLLTSPLGVVGRRIYNRFVRGGDLVVSGKPYHIFRDPDNDTVGEQVARHPDRLLFYAFINPKGSRDAVEVLEDCRSRFDVRGVKTHAWFHTFDPATDLVPLARRCVDLGLPLLIHLGGSARTGNAEALLAACPGLKLILAHAGIPYFQRIWPLLDRYPDLHLDVSGPYLNAPKVEEVVRAVGSRRVLFGTDGPYGLRTEGGYSYRPMMEWIERLPIPDGEKEDIFSGNFLRLTGG